MRTSSMQQVRKSGKWACVAWVVMSSAAAMADEAGWYAGVSAGQARATIDVDRIRNELLANGFVTTAITEEDRNRGYKIFGGYRLNRNFAVEGGFFNLGEFSFKATTLPPGTLSGNIRLRGLHLDLVGTLPITEKFSVLGRIGANHAEASDSFAGTGAVLVLNPNPSKRETNLKVGLGLQYAFTEALSLRAEIERYRINDAVGNKGDVDLVSLGLVYRFGAKAQAPAPRAQAPEPVRMVAAAPPSPPEPVSVTPPPPSPPMPMPMAMPMKVTLAADSLFAFDQSVVSPAGKQELDRLAADLRGVSYDVISVTGHADRIGSHAYNMKLSTRRAEAVSSYLVASGGIASSKIAAKGVDGADPVTKPGDCPGTKVTPALIACLQPDRRVEIEVSGTR